MPTHYRYEDIPKAGRTCTGRRVTGERIDASRTYTSTRAASCRNTHTTTSNSRTSSGRASVLHRRRQRQGGPASTPVRSCTSLSGFRTSRGAGGHARCRHLRPPRKDSIDSTDAYLPRAHEPWTEWQGRARLRRQPRARARDRGRLAADARTLAGCSRPPERLTARPVSSARTCWRSRPALRLPGVPTRVVEATARRFGASTCSSPAAPAGRRPAHPTRSPSRTGTRRPPPPSEHVRAFVSAALPA